MIEADGLAHYAAPAEVEGLGNHLCIGPRRARSQKERVFEFDAVGFNVQI